MLKSLGDTLADVILRLRHNPDAIRSTSASQVDSESG
jgi:hypothetical protein